MNELKEVVENLYTEFKPLSIFLYGSMATETNNSKSDYEVGIIFGTENYISRNILSKSVNNSNFSVYPFKKEELINYEIDTPFQNNIYILSLIKSAKTLMGEEVIENLKNPNITTLDLLLDTRFNLGYALASVQNYKNGNIGLANELFYKSCLFATRNLIYSLTGNLEVSYNAIFEQSKKIGIPEEYQTLLN